METPATVVCPSCGLPREISARQVRRAGGVTSDCRNCRRNVVLKPQAHYAFWTEQWSMEEIREVANAIWPNGKEEEWPP